MQINVIDSIMGSGKSQYAIQLMNKDIENDYIYITPYLNEVERIKDNCKNRKFIEPKECEERRIYSKSKSLKELMQEGKDIATTHSLFKIMDEEAERILEAGSYTLILDEVMDVVQQIPITKSDLELLFVKTNTLEVSNNGLITLGKDAEDYTSLGAGKFTQLIHMAKLKRLFKFEDIVILWEFPVDIFRYFKEVYILTYLFDGQIQKYFFDFYDVKYDKYTVIKNKENLYELVEYDKNLDNERVNEISKLISIYEGNLNEVGKKETALSFSWFDKSSTRLKEMLSNDIYNYFRHINNVKVADVLWTCYKESGVKVKNYSRGFLPHNMRATNEYSNTHTLAYAVNRYISPMLIRYFNSKDVYVNQDLYALSEMIQWIWRSRIRNGENINIFIPSIRMRNILYNFIQKNSTRQNSQKT